MVKFSLAFICNRLPNLNFKAIFFLHTKLFAHCGLSVGHLVQVGISALGMHGPMSDCSRSVVKICCIAFGGCLAMIEHNSSVRCPGLRAKDGMLRVNKYDR